MCHHTDGGRVSVIELAHGFQSFHVPSPSSTILLNPALHNTTVNISIPPPSRCAHRGSAYRKPPLLLTSTHLCFPWVTSHNTTPSHVPDLFHVSPSPTSCSTFMANPPSVPYVGESCQKGPTADPLRFDVILHMWASTMRQWQAGLIPSLLPG